MKVARVVGNVVSTVSTAALDGRTLLLCEFVDLQGRETEAYTIAVDTVGAGAGETVLILDEDNSARQVLAEENAPVRAVVVGIIDDLNV